MRCAVASDLSKTIRIAITAELHPVLPIDSRDTLASSQNLYLNNVGVSASI